MSPLTLAAFLALAEQCAPSVAPETLAAIVKVESAFHPYAINVNGPGGGPIQPKSLPEAVSVARSLLAAGRSADFGLGQINGKNFGWLGLTPETVFDPCRNVAASAAVLTAASRYNTGHPSRGFANGYVRRVIAAGRANGTFPAVPAPARAAFAASTKPCAPAWDVWASCPAPPPRRQEQPAVAESAPTAAPIVLTGRLASESRE